MKQLLLLFIVIYNFNGLWCQSPYILSNTSMKQDNDISSPLVIDSSAISEWVQLQNYDVEISNDGRFFTYGIVNNEVELNTLILQSVDSKWKVELKGATKVSFSKNSKQFAFLRNDTLYFQNVGEDVPSSYKVISSYKEPNSNSGEWIAFQEKKDSRILIVKNRISEKEQPFFNVTNYSFDEEGKYLIFQTLKRSGTGEEIALQQYNLKTGVLKNLFSGVDVSINAITFDKDGFQLAFCVGYKSKPFIDHSIWFYKEGMKKAVLRATNTSQGIENGLVIQPSISFSNDGKYIYFSLEKLEVRTRNPEAVKVNVWSYKDLELQSHQLRQSSKKSFTALIKANLDSIERVLILNRSDEDVMIPKKGDFALITQHSINIGDRFWLKDTRTFWLVSLIDGRRKALTGFADSYLYFSSNGRYLVWFDGDNENYFSYEIETGKVVNMSYSVPKGLLLYDNEFYKERRKVDAGRIAWLEGDSGLLVSDNYDIWLLDPSGVKAARCVTGGYGRLNKIRFDILGLAKYVNGIPKNESLILTAFNKRTKYNGFYRLKLGNKEKFEMLTMGPYIYYLSHSMRLSTYNVNHEPVKARDADVWVVKRCTYNEAPNYYITTDFKRYIPLTNLAPHKKYNWLTSELIEFKQLDGSMSQGVLFKPQYFDSTKKYPLLINYHDQHSHLLFDYQRPGYTGDAFLDVSWFVSRGYLVFLPDIYLDKHLPGPAAYNTIVGAAKHLSNLPYIDSKKMGIAGHSFGGGMTNYIVTHTDLFAAAFEGAGVSNLISSSLQLGGNGLARLGPYSATTQSYPSLWENPDVWIKDSPIFSADKVSTPLLMFHCRPDGAVPWEQAVEFFVALRRLNKKVWLLEYDDGDHNLHGNNAKDLALRATQFFDYYLKGNTAPVWMTKGIPASLKGIDNGLELDKRQIEP